jgi:hypothetical protein
MHESMRRLLPELGRHKIGSLITTTHRHTFPLSPGILFYQQQYNHRPSPTLLYSASPIEDETERAHFDTIEVIEAESQAVLDNLTEHDFQDVFKDRQKCWERCIRAEGNFIEIDAGQQGQS